MPARRQRAWPEGGAACRTRGCGAGRGAAGVRAEHPREAEPRLEATVGVWVAEGEGLQAGCGPGRRRPQGLQQQSRLGAQGSTRPERPGRGWHLEMGR